MRDRITGLVRHWFRRPESAVAAPSLEELEQSRRLMVKFDSARPSADELANGLRTLLERLGNPVMIDKDFGNPKSPSWKYQADFLITEVVKILELKMSDDPGRAPVYEQAIRLSHAIQSEARAAVRRQDAYMSVNAFLRKDDFSDEKLRKDAAKMDRLQQKRAESQARQDASIHKVLSEFQIALSELGIPLSDRMGQFLQGVKDRVLNFDQFLLADRTFSDRTREASMLDRIDRAQEGKDAHVRSWATYAQQLGDMLVDLTARGSKIESVILPTRPRRKIEEVATGTDDETGAAAAK